MNNLATGWGICGSVVRDKHENVCNLFFSHKHNAFENHPCAFLSLFTHQWSTGNGQTLWSSRSFYQLQCLSILNSNPPLWSLEHSQKPENLPSKFDLFLRSHHGLQLTQGVRMKKMEFLTHIAQCRLLGPATPLH